MAIKGCSSRRSVLLGLPACAVVAAWGTATTWTTRSWAGAAVPIALGELVGRSSAIVVGTPRQASCTWEGQKGARRIVTYSQVEVLQSIDGRPTGDSYVHVRTLGGHVGDIGQIVHGEATLDLQKPQVLFLHPNASGSFSVTALAQGHYPLLNDETGTPRLQSSPRLGDFVTDDPFCAVARLRGRTVGSCEQLVWEELNRAH